jgi:hypothetical protein
MAVSTGADLDPAITAWLLDPAFPSVRRLARSRLGLASMDDGPPPPKITDEPWIRTLITPAAVVRHPYLKWAGAHWRLGALAELDADASDPAIAAYVGPAFDADMGWLGSPGHADSTKAVQGRARLHGSQEGLAAWAAVRLGLAEDPRVAFLVQRLLESQWPDGGWNCDRKPASTHSSFNESFYPLRALAVFGDTHARSALGRDARAAADRAAGFFLEHHVTRSHTTGELAHPNVDGMRWPPYWHYDRLAGLRMLLAAGHLSDPRTAEALGELRAARRPDGTWHPDKRYWKGPGSKADVGVEAVDWTADGEGRMLTLQALEVLAAAADR